MATVHDLQVDFAERQLNFFAGKQDAFAAVTKGAAGNGVALLGGATQLNMTSWAGRGSPTQFGLLGGTRPGGTELN